MAAYSGGILDWSLTRSWRYRLPTAAARGDGATAPAPEWAPMKTSMEKNPKWRTGKVPRLRLDRLGRLLDEVEGADPRGPQRERVPG